MTARQRIKHGSDFPFDAPDSWRDGLDGRKPPAPIDKAHLAARGVIAELEDRRGIKQGFDGIDESTRADIVKALAEIIRVATR